MALKNDCFALPAGVAWTPVQDALADLRGRLSPVARVETVALAQAEGRVLARDVAAPISLPPADNSAVDGYALAHASLGAQGEQRLSLRAGRAAAGVPRGVCGCRGWWCRRPVWAHKDRGVSPRGAGGRRSSPIRAAAGLFVWGPARGGAIGPAGMRWPHRLVHACGAHR